MKFTQLALILPFVVAQQGYGMESESHKKESPTEKNASPASIKNRKRREKKAAERRTQAAALLAAHATPKSAADITAIDYDDPYYSPQSQFIDFVRWNNIEAAQKAIQESRLCPFTHDTVLTANTREWSTMRSALSIAAQHGHVEMITMLLKHGGDLLLRDYQKKLPKDYAFENGHKDLFILLHNASIDLYHKEKQQQIIDQKQDHK